MPVFVCYFGDCDNLALQGDRPPFGAQDAFGGVWHCVKTEAEQIGGDIITPSVWEMMQAQATLHRLGKASKGTTVKTLLADDEVDLRRKLVLATYPHWSECQAALFHAGWTYSNLAFATGEP